MSSNGHHRFIVPQHRVLPTYVTMCRLDDRKFAFSELAAE